MLERFNRLIFTLGSYKAAAEHLGYTERQLLNIRKSLEQGKSLSNHVDRYIARMISQQEQQEQSEKAIELNDQLEQPKQGQPDASIP